MTINLYKPFARKLQRKSRKRPLPPSNSGAASSAGSSAGEADVGVGKPQRSGSGGGGGSVVTALTALSGEGGSAVTAVSANACGGSAGDSLGTHDGNQQHSGSGGQSGRPSTRREAQRQTGQRSARRSEEAPRQAAAGESSRRRRLSSYAPASPGAGASSSLTDRHGIIPGPQTLEVEGEDAVPLLYDFWERQVVPHRQSSFARTSYHDVVDSGGEGANPSGSSGRRQDRGEKGPMKKGVSKASVTSFATTVQISNTAALASVRRRAAFQLDGGGSDRCGGSGHGRSSIGLLMYDSGGWTSYPTSSRTSSQSSGRASLNLAPSSGGLADRQQQDAPAARSDSESSHAMDLRRPSLSDPYPYWMWPTSRSDTFSSPWSPEEEEYWGKSGGIGVRAVMGMGPSKGAGHKRSSSLGSFSSRESSSAGSVSGTGGKMDAQFAHGALPSAPAYPLQSASRRRDPNRDQRATPPNSPSRRPASAAMQAQRRMMERRQAQRRRRAALRRPPATGGGAAAAGGYATPANSTRDLLWNIPEGREEAAAPSSVPGPDGGGGGGGGGPNSGKPTGARKEPGAQPVIGPSDRLTPVSAAIASVIEEERDRGGSLNTPPLEGLSSEELGSSGERESTEEDEIDVPGDERRNRPDGDQPNDPGDHGALYEEPAMEIPIEMQQMSGAPVAVGMSGMEEVPLHAAAAAGDVFPAERNNYAIDAPSHMEGYGGAPPRLGRAGESRNMVDPAVFRAVLRSKLAASAGVFDWNAPSGFRPVVEEIVIPDDATDVSGELTIPVCIMEDEDWERERRRRGFPGQINLAQQTANESGKISVLTGAGRDDVSALGEPPAEPPAPATAGPLSAPRAPRGEDQWELKGNGTRPSASVDIRDPAEDKTKGIVVGSPQEKGPGASDISFFAAAAKNSKEASIFVGQVRDEQEVSSASSDADSDVREMTEEFVKEFAAEKEEEEEEKEAAAAAPSSSSCESAGIKTPAPTVTPPSSPAPQKAALKASPPSSPRSRSASEMSEEELSIVDDAGLGLVDAVMTKESDEREQPTTRRASSRRDRPWFAAAAEPSSSPRSRSASELSEDELRAAEEAGLGLVDPAVVEEKPEDECARVERPSERRLSIELSVGFQTDDGEGTKEDEDEDGDNNTLELAAAALASASAAAAACAPPLAEDLQVEAVVGQRAEATTTARYEQDEKPLVTTSTDPPEPEEELEEAAPADDADVLRLLGMVTHSPTAAATDSQKHFLEEAQDNSTVEEIEDEAASCDDDDEEDEDKTFESGWQTDEEDCTTLQDEESLRSPQPLTHEEIHGGSVFAAFANGDLSLGSASSLNSTSCDEDSEAEAAERAVDVMETVDELGAEHEASEDEDSLATPSGTNQEEPPSPVEGMPWNQYIAPVAVGGSASHSSTSTSNNTPPSLPASLSPPRLGTDADAASLSSGRSSGLASQASSARSQLSQASSARVMAALGGIIDSESDDGDSLIFEDAPIYEEDEEDEDCVEYEHIPAGEGNGADDVSAGSFERRETFDSLDDDAESASAASSTLVDHIDELLDGVKEREAAPKNDAIEEEEEDCETYELDGAKASSSLPEEHSESPPSYFTRTAETDLAVTSGSANQASSSSPISSLTAAHEAGRFESLPSATSKKVKWIDFGESSVLPDCPASHGPCHKRGGSVLSAGGSSCGGFSGTAATESVTRPSEDERSHDFSSSTGRDGVYTSLRVPDSPSASVRSSSSRSSCAIQERKIRDSIRGLEMSFSEDEGEHFDDQSHASSSLNSSFNSSVASSVMSESEGNMVNDMILKLKQESARRRARLTRREAKASHGKKAPEKPRLERMGSF